MTNLQKLRRKALLTQGQLAYLSKVNISTIQAYEAKRRDINKASAETLRKLAHVLQCTVEDLME